MGPRCTLTGLLALTSNVLATVVTTGTQEVQGSCTADALTIVGFMPSPNGAFYTAVSTASLYSELQAAVPTDQCKLLNEIPASARDDYFTWASKVQTYWQAQRSSFSHWSTTCDGTFGPENTGIRAIITPYLEPTAQQRLNDFTAGPVTCSATTFTTPASTAGAAGPRRTAALGAGVAAAAMYAIAAA